MAANFDNKIKEISPDNDRL